MQRQRRRDTAPEVTIRSLLHRSGFRFRVDYPLPGLRRRADIAFPRTRLAVMVDGCFWHGCPEHGTWPKENAAWWREKIEGNIARDRDTDTKLDAAGWIVVRAWEHEDPAEVARRVAALLTKGAAPR
jgi:DNA mismatch endonuclease, patch repair protein